MYRNSRNVTVAFTPSPNIIFCDCKFNVHFFYSNYSQFVNISDNKMNVRILVVALFSCRCYHFQTFENITFKFSKTVETHKENVSKSLPMRVKGKCFQVIICVRVHANKISDRNLWRSVYYPFV